MASGYFSTKTKRKDLDDDIFDDFSDFSLFSPARKIRRLDAEMDPIMEEEEEEPWKRVPLVFEQQQQQQVGGGGGGSFGAVIEELEEEELSSEAENEERAIVLFNPNPINTLPLFLSPSNFSLTLHSDIVSGFKTSNQFLWTSKNPNTLEEEEDENEVARQGLTTNNSGCLAVVPWMPTSQIASQIAPKQVTEISRAEISELMESENDMGAATMDIEEESNAVAEFNGMSEGGIHQWQQKHCMIPQQIPHNTSTPIVWFQ